ncbi:hypothetical protein GY45DRAFT_1331373 [Cubamyces sp. BRFM 1775]|nr:hypothetical protein GY45DRAFT_1331373 [Cubamyces sp. BRFM 1775]
MPGANYMGGKRNAARARVKDATGKVQRNHFGKKRFEILRTGLSKGQATTSHAQRARSGLNARHEISLAHAHRTVGEPTDDTQTWLPNAYDSSPAIGDAHSTPTSASSRSRILGVLDAENPRTSRQNPTNARSSRLVDESSKVYPISLLLSRRVNPLP